MTSHPREDGLFLLERTGPYVPPISMPYDAIIVTDEFRKLLERSALTGFTFRPVIKSRIVHLDWHNWDKTAEEPEEYPTSGEPEDYILGRPHSSDVAMKIGELWELCLEEHAEVLRDLRNPADHGLTEWAPYDVTHDLFLLLSSWDGTDWFRATNVGYTYVSDRAKTWLEKTAYEWVSFEMALTK
jgi:hypothetical protein